LARAKISDRHSGKQTRYYLAAEAAVDTEIGIGCDDYGIRENFAHAHKTSIGKAHGYVSVLIHQVKNPLKLISKRGCGHNGLST
jgi:hypothetical protein